MNAAVQTNRKDQVNPDREAMLVAREYSSGINWGTIGFATTVCLAYSALLTLSVVGAISTSLAIIGLSALTYALYTPLHEAVHNNIAGSDKQRAWVDTTIGTLVGILMMASYTMHKAAHFAHHSKTNHHDHDPDTVFGEGKAHQVLWGALTITVSEYKWYFKNKWGGAANQDKIHSVLELSAAIGLRVGIAAAGYPVEALLFAVLPNLLGMMFTAIVFAWIVHHPHDTEKRYLNTSTFVFNRWLDTPITYLWLFQNYHSIHHLFPRVAFHQYRNVFRKIEPIMSAKGSPIYNVGH